MRALKPKFIVGIGGSAGALNAYKALLGALPSDTDMAFIIVSHMNPTAYSELALILSRHTEMPILVASTEMPIWRNCIYVIPPDADLLVVNYSLKVVSPRSRRNKQIDLLFISLAESMKTHAIGVVLSGYDGDGTEGCRQIKAKGGITFSQDESADVIHMPLSAQASDCVDFVLSPDKIAAEITKISKKEKARAKKL